MVGAFCATYAATGYPCFNIILDRSLFFSSFISEQAEQFKKKARELRGEIERKSGEVENLHRLMLSDTSAENLSLVKGHLQVLFRSSSSLYTIPGSFS